MRKIAYAVATTAAVVLVLGWPFHSPKTASASSHTKGIVTPYSVELTINVEALPRQDIDCRC